MLSEFLVCMPVNRTFRVYELILGFTQMLYPISYMFHYGKSPVYVENGDKRVMYICVYALTCGCVR